MTDEDPSPYPTTIIGRGIRLFFQFTGNLSGSGSWKLKTVQQQLVDGLLPALKTNIRRLVEQQLSQPFYMQFWLGGRISPIFFKDFNLPKELRIPDPEFADRLYKVEMFVDGRKQHANVTFYNGRIHCLEFKKPLKFYEGKEIRFGGVTLGKPKQSFTVAIDRHEHGKEGP
jgi:hypothetical protein